jgi:hypothetical protein
MVHLGRQRLRRGRPGSNCLRREGHSEFDCVRVNRRIPQLALGKCDIEKPTGDENAIIRSNLFFIRGQQSQPGPSQGAGTPRLSIMRSTLSGDEERMSKDSQYHLFTRPTSPTTGTSSRRLTPDIPLRVRNPP